MEKDIFVDLEKVRFDILTRKIQDGLEEFKKHPNLQWTPLRLEKPLLETLLTIVEQQEEMKKLKDFYEYFQDLYGQGLEIANWHLNGDLEAFDNFFESATKEED